MSRIDIRVSEAAGFCWGVERALRVAREAARNAGPGPVSTFGPLIHNPTVIAQLAAEGIGVIDDASGEIAGTVIVRSHGVEREVQELLERRAAAVVDATCSFVKSAHEKAARLYAAGYGVIVLGEPDHPEVRGILSYAGADALVVQSPEELPTVLPRRVGVVVQTTQSPERLAVLTAAVAPRVRELLVYNTICDATERRQRAAVAMAAQVDLVIVVGGRKSGNTTRLAELCAAVQPRTYHVEEAGEIRPEWLAGVSVAGVTAGASTPRGQIEAVVARLESLSAHEERGER